MALDISSVSNGEGAVCARCGTRYPKRKGNFAVCYAALYRGIGTLSVCKNCVDAMYTQYFQQARKPEDAIRQVCRKLDLYYDEAIYQSVVAKSVPRTLIDQYIAKLNQQRYAGMSYDDTLINENTMWQFGIVEAEQEPVSVVEPEPVIEPEQEPEAEPEPEEDPIEIDPALVDFWGNGLEPEAYDMLQKRYEEWRGDGTFDIATEMLVKQICLTELDIARDRAEGRSPEKDIQILNSLMGSANLKPAQQQKTDEAQALAEVPLGVWLYKYENQRPLPEVDEQLKDVNHIRKYVFTWMGHLCKMLDIKNAYSDLYDEAIAKYSVQKPEYEGDEGDDEDDSSSVEAVTDE